MTSFSGVTYVLVWFVLRIYAFIEAAALRSILLQYAGAPIATCVLFGTDGYGFQEPRVQMVRGYGFHIISRLKMDGSGENRFAAVRFTIPGQVCGLITSGLRFQDKSAGQFRSCLHSTFFFFQHLSSRTATPPMPFTLGVLLPLRTNSIIFRHPPPSPQQPPLVPIAHPGPIDDVVLLNF